MWDAVGERKGGFHCRGDDGVEVEQIEWRRIQHSVRLSDSRIHRRLSDREKKMWIETADFLR